MPEVQIDRSSWFREHFRRPGTDGGCWFFASWYTGSDRAAGRFDLASPEGTCYLADTPGVAAMERVGRFTAKHKPVPADFVSHRVVTEINGSVLPARAADLTSRRASGFGVTGELFTMPDYTVPQQWAAAIRARGYGALQYTPRFSPGGRAVAAFGSTGAQPQPVLAHTPLRQVLSQLGIRIAEIPASTSLTIIEPDGR